MQFRLPVLSTSAYKLQVTILLKIVDYIMILIYSYLFFADIASENVHLLWWVSEGVATD